MLSRTVLVALSALASLASAQSDQFTSCCNLTVTQLPNQNLPNTWCRAQRNSCPELCGGQTSANNCTESDLTYNCECLNGKTPNISDYAQTLPSLMCQEWVGLCTDAHPNDAEGQAFCQSFKCGSRNASAVGAAASSSAAAASSTSAESSSSTSASATSSSATQASSAPKSSGAAMALGVGKEYGTGIVGALLFGLFGLAL